MERLFIPKEIHKRHVLKEVPEFLSRIDCCPRDSDFLIDLVQLYQIGVNKDMVYFPFMDINGDIHFTQVKTFDKLNKSILKGRFAHKYPYYPAYGLKREFVGRLERRNKDYDTVSTLFGAHLINQYPEATICIFEACKDAIYATIEYGHPKDSNIINLATGALTWCQKDYHYSFLDKDSRNIYFIPDPGQKAFFRWSKLADRLSQRYLKSIFECKDTVDHKQDVAGSLSIEWIERKNQTLKYFTDKLGYTIEDLNIVAQPEKFVPAYHIGGVAFNVNGISELAFQSSGHTASGYGNSFALNDKTVHYNYRPPKIRAKHTINPSIDSNYEKLSKIYPEKTLKELNITPEDDCDISNFIHPKLLFNKRYTHKNKAVKERIETLTLTGDPFPDSPPWFKGWKVREGKNYIGTTFGDIEINHEPKNVKGWLISLSEGANPYIKFEATKDVRNCDENKYQGWI